MNKEVSNYKGKYVNISTSILKVEIENYLAMIDGFSKDNIDGRIKTAIFTSYPSSAACHRDFCSNPKLLTLIRQTQKNYPHNNTIFEQFQGLIRKKSGDISGYVPAKYKQQLIHNLYDNSNYNHIAFIDSIYHIKKDYQGQINLWKELCSNGIFDQWKWCAPFNRYLPEGRFLPGGKTLADGSCKVIPAGKELFHERFNEKPLILLLRIYEINRIISAQDDINRGRKRSRDSYIHTERKCNRIPIANPVISDDDFIKIRNKLEATLMKFDMCSDNPKRIHYIDCFIK